MNATIKQNETPSRTTVYNLPLEMLDIILHKSYLHWIMNPSAQQRDEEVIRSLISVDVSFYRRITRQWFKKAMWRYLEDFYGKDKKRSAIIRNNRNYLVDNIQPSDELIASLLSLNCINEEQGHFIHRHSSTRVKKDELLYVMESVDEANFSNVVKCLWHTDHKAMTKIIENGGGVIKLKVHIRGTKCTASMGTELLHQKIEDLRNNVNPMSDQTNKCIVQLREEGIKILSSQLDRHGVVVWIWCRTQAALVHIQKLYQSNQLKDVFFEPTCIQPSTSVLINIDINQFKKTIVERSISINFTHRIEVQRIGCVFGVTKLRNKIYGLCRTLSFDQGEILVLEDRTPFRLLKEIKIKEIGLPWDIASSEKENCLYISDNLEQCVWKITIAKDDRHVVIKWMTTDYHPRTLSASSDGQLLLINDRSHSLMIYGSDAELIRSIPLPGPRHNIFPFHAVVTSIGNFVVTHTVEDMEEAEKDDLMLEKGELKKRLERREGQLGSSWDTTLVVSELNRDGKTVMCRFIDSNEPLDLHSYGYDLSLDSDDRIFMTNSHHNRVGFLDSGLRWNRILYSARGEKEEGRIRQPFRLCYDEEMKQLIVLGHNTSDVNVYTLSLH